MSDKIRKRKHKPKSSPTITIKEDWWIENEFYERGKYERITREHWIVALANEHGWTRGAELGVYKGRTFCFVLQQCPNLTLYGVDLWDAQPDNEGPENYVDRDHKTAENRTRNNAKQFGDRAIIIKDWTLEAAKQVEDRSLDFVFIDGDHSMLGVATDILVWQPKVKEEGWIIGHDINWPTVRAVVNKLLPGYDVGPDNAWARKKNIGER